MGSIPSQGNIMNKGPEARSSWTFDNMKSVKRFRGDHRGMLGWETMVGEMWQGDGPQHTSLRSCNAKPNQCVGMRHCAFLMFLSFSGPVCCCDNNIWQEQQEEGRVYLAWRLEGTVHGNGESMASGAWGDPSHRICLILGSRDRQTLVLSPLSPFHSVQNPSPWDRATHIQGVSSHLNQPELATPFQTCPKTNLIISHSQVHGLVCRGFQILKLTVKINLVPLTE